MVNSDQMERAEGMSALLDQMADAYRDPTIPPGTILGETSVAGQQVRWTKQRSMVRRGDTPLPERFEAWDVYGRMSKLPTAQMNYQLAKPNAEMPDKRAFHLHVSGVTRDNCKICPPEKTPYEGSCEWCFASSGNRLEKKFADQTEQEAHFDYYHPREWATLQRELDRRERREELENQKRLAEAMLKVAERPTSVTPEAASEPKAAKKGDA